MPAVPPSAHLPCPRPLWQLWLEPCLFPFSAPWWKDPVDGGVWGGPGPGCSLSLAPPTTVLGSGLNEA